MENNINTHPNYDEVRIGSLVYCKNRVNADWTTGLVVKKYNFGQRSSRDNNLCFLVLVKASLIIGFHCAS